VDATGRLFDRLAGPDGLTEHASTFTRPDVLVALGAGLAGTTRAELEELADRFLAERAVSVVADRALEERRWSTPDLLAVEQRLVTAATGRTGEQTAVVSYQAVRDALAAHATAGPTSRRWCGMCARAAPAWPWSSGGDGQDLRPGDRPPRLAAGRLPAPGHGPNGDRHPEPAG
jgi:hypothetical protein